MAVNYVVVKTTNGDWGVKRHGTDSFSMRAINTAEAIKLGRVLSIKNNGKLVIVENTIRQRIYFGAINSKGTFLSIQKLFWVTLIRIII